MSTMYEQINEAKEQAEADEIEEPDDEDLKPPRMPRNLNDFAQSLEEHKVPIGESKIPLTRVKKAPELPVIERRNWLLHHHFLRQEWDACKGLVKEQSDETNGSCEYASYTRGLIFRQEGKIQESLDMFQACAMLNPKDSLYLKQIARSLFLLGKSKTAIDVLNEALKLAPDDWDIFHWKGVCYRQMQDRTAAKENLRQAVTLSKHEESFVLLAEIFAEETDYMNAIDCYKRALELSPENPDLLTSLGLLYLKTDSEQQAFEALGKAFAFDPSHPGAILAAGSMMQQHADYDVALTKYRVAAQQWPDNAQLWSNIGMCFYGKKKFVAAISCLKRANYLAPFDWKILYNLGMVHLEMQQYASAFHFLSASININPKHALTYMTLAVALTNLEDFPNARQAYEHALTLDVKDPVLAFNFAVFLFKQNDMDKAKYMIEQYHTRIQNSKEIRTGALKIQKEITEMADRLSDALRVGRAPEAERSRPASAATRDGSESRLNTAAASTTRDDSSVSNLLSNSPERNLKEMTE